MLDVVQPCLGRVPRPRRSLTSPDTPCTCCGCLILSRNGSRYRNSSPSADVSRGSVGSSLVRDAVWRFQEYDEYAASGRVELFPYLIQTYNLAVCFLDLPQLHQEVPESRLGNNGVWCKDSHPVQLRGGIGLSWQMAADDLIFLEATCNFQPSATCHLPHALYAIPARKIL